GADRRMLRLAGLARRGFRARSDADRRWRRADALIHLERMVHAMKRNSPSGFTSCLVALLLFLMTTVLRGETTSILLVGNSILYTNNMPAVLTDIGQRNGKPIKADMFALGGAQISELVSSSVVRSAIENGSYDFVIFHDRGGDALCAAPSRAPRSPACDRMIEDHRKLVGLIRRSGAIPYLLGTYQPPIVSLELTKAERHIADTVGIRHIEISEKWNTIREAVEDAPWLADDGMHPGRALTALMATEVYRAIFSGYPAASRLATTAPLHIPQDKLRNVLAAGDLQAE